MTTQIPAQNQTPQSTPSVKLETLRELHGKLIGSFDSSSQGTMATIECQPDLDEIDNFLVRLRQELKLARTQRDAQLISWAAAATSQWQTLMTTVMRVPRDIRNEVGIDSGDSFIEPEFQISEHLSNHAYRIGTTRKLLSLVQKMRYYQRHPGRVHEDIPSTPEERLSDWNQAQLYFALDAINQRFHLRTIALDDEALNLLDAVFLEDVIQLVAYLTWEKNHAGTGEESPEFFYEKAQQYVSERLNDVDSVDCFFVDAVVSWLKEQLLIQERSETFRDERRARKSQRLSDSCGLAAELANQVARDQTDAFDLNIVQAIGSDADASAVVMESVYGREESLFRQCSTVLEAIIVSQCVPR